MTAAANPPDGIVLFAHGSRDPLWRGPIEAVAQQIRAAHPQLLVSCAYLELCQPSLEDAVALMLTELQNAINSVANYSIDTSGKTAKSLRIRIVPMFLGMGKHAREDLPQLAASLRDKYPQIVFEITCTVGEDPRVTALLAQLAVDA